MPKHKCIIIDDEKHARESLSTLVKICNEKLTIAAQCADVDSAIEAIIRYKPAIVFLDISLGEQSAFQLLSKIEKVDFQLIFTTAFSEFAIKAFKVNAIDYLLKPINLNELRNAIDKSINNISKVNSPEQVENLLKTIDANKAERIAISTVSGITFIFIEDIIRIQGSGNYSTLSLKNKSTITASKSLKHFESLLPLSGFFRTHQSHIVNLKMITQIQSSDGLLIELSNGETVPLVRNKKEGLMKLMV